MNLTTQLAVIGVGLLAALAQIGLKAAVDRIDLKAAFDQGLLSTAATMLSSPVFGFALSLYALSVLVWLWALSRVDLSTAYPFLSLGFVFTLGFAAVLLKEEITFYKAAGTILVFAGCFLVSRG